MRKCVRSGQRAQREVEFFPRCGVGGGDRASFTSTCRERVGGSELNGEELLLKQWVLERLRCLDRAPFPELWCCVGVQRIYRHSGFGSCVLCPLRRSEGVIFFSFFLFLAFFHRL